MPRYAVRIKVVISNTIMIDANNEDEAEQEANNLFDINACDAKYSQEATDVKKVSDG